MTHRAIIAEMGEHLEPGTTIREMCPRCDGGSSSEKSLSLTKSEDGYILWQCWRASCDLAPGNTGAVGEAITRVQKPKRRVFTGDTEVLSAAHLERIEELWGITDPEYWWWTPQHMGRVAMSIRSPKYLHRGWVLRDIYARSAVKALTYVNENEEGISWYRSHLSAPTVVVEDIPSACRAAEYVNAIALCGTGVGLTRAEEIQKYATLPIVIALDQDATAEAFLIARKWALLWGDVKVLPLQQDIKNMKESDLCDMLNGLSHYS